MQPTQVNFTRDEEVLAVALELSGKEWKIALDDGKRKVPTVCGGVAKHEEPQRRLQQAVGVIEATKKKWKLPAEVRVVIVYEAGQDGFWIKRGLEAEGYEVWVTDAASVQVNRQARRAKTDRLDALLLVRALRGWLRGELDRMRMVQVPSVEAEGQRHLMRERGQLQKEIGQHRDRMRKLLQTMGCVTNVDELGGLLEHGTVKGADGSALPAGLQQRLVRECARLQLVQEQLAALEKTLPEQLPEELRQRIEQLMQLKAVGPVGASRLLLELYWRDFNNRREVGSCVGLAPQPYDSGNSRVDQGISKAGNRRVRALLIEMAWMWIRYQSQSELAQWYFKRISGTGANKRSKRVAIVAVARRLAILLWRYLKHGVLPKDVALKPVKVTLQAA